MNTKLALIPDRSHDYRVRFHPEEFDVVYIDEGVYPIIGRRYDEIWVHWLCYEEPGYRDFVHALFNMIALSSKPVVSRLFP